MPRSLQINNPIQVLVDAVDVSLFRQSTLFMLLIG